jgi:hypothetical protein
MARKKYSRAQVEAAIRSIQSVCKRKPGDKPFAEEWVEYKRTERELEERKFQRLAALGNEIKINWLK